MFAVRGFENLEESNRDFSPRKAMEVQEGRGGNGVAFIQSVRNESFECPTRY